MKIKLSTGKEFDIERLATIRTGMISITMEDSRPAYEIATDFETQNRIDVLEDNDAVKESYENYNKITFLDKTGGILVMMALQQTQPENSN